MHWLLEDVDLDLRCRSGLGIQGGVIRPIRVVRSGLEGNHAEAGVGEGVGSERAGVGGKGARKRAEVGIRATGVEKRSSLF